MGNRNRDFLLSVVVNPAPFGSGRQYNPLVESASGAFCVIYSNGRLAVPMKSLPDSLSRSMTAKCNE